MSNVLEKICALRREDLAAIKRSVPLAEVEAAARAAAPPRGFVGALREALGAGRYGLIAEIKKASPSKSLIRADFDPPALARAYWRGGATCLSVLTEGRHFMGDDADLRGVAKAVPLPVLRKDFTLEPYQVIEARAIGADCVLLIMAALGEAQARELEQAARAWGLDVLIEVHDEAELERALRLESPLIGVNNRNLKTLAVDLTTTERLAALLPEDRLLVSESGLATPRDLARLSAAGAHCFLIGEALMREADVQAATAALLAPSDTKRAVHG